MASEPILYPVSEATYHASLDELMQTERGETYAKNMLLGLKKKNNSLLANFVRYNAVGSQDPLTTMEFQGVLLTMFEKTQNGLPSVQQKTLDTITERASQKIYSPMLQVGQIERDGNIQVLRLFHDYRSSPDHPQLTRIGRALYDLVEEEVKKNLLRHVKKASGQ